MVEVVPEVSDSLTFLFQYSDHAFYLKLSFGEYCLVLAVFSVNFQCQQCIKLIAVF